MFKEQLKICMILFLIFMNPVLAQTGDPFIGTFSGSGLTLTLKGQNNRYNGTAFLKGQNISLSVQKSGADIISGVYSMQGESAPFQARVQGNTMTLTADGEVYTLTRQAGSVASQSASQTATGKIKNDDWGISFTSPTGWSSQLTEAGYVFGSNKTKGILLLLPNDATTMQDMRDGAKEGIVEGGGTQLRLDGQIKSFGKSGLAATYSGILQGEKAKAYAIGLLSPHGVGAIVLVAEEPQSFSTQHTKVAETLAHSIGFYKSPIPPVAQEWKQKLSGCRLSYFNRYSSGSGGGYTSETTIDLCAQGYFKYNLNDETVWNASPGTLTGGYSMQYGKGSGTWKVIAQGSQPILQLNYYDGKVASYKLSTNQKEQTFLDGDRYLRTCNPNDQVVEARPQCF